MRSNAYRLVLVLGLLVGQPASAQQSGPLLTTTKGVLVDFQDADLKLVLTALAEAGSINLVYGDLPAKHLTLHMRQPVAPADILPLLKGIATSNGLRVTEEDGLVRVAAAETGPARPTQDTTHVARDTSVEPRLMIYRLRHVQAARIASTLQAIFGGRGGAGTSGALSQPALSQSLRDIQQSPFTNGGPTAASQPSLSAGAEPAAASTGAPTALPGKLRGDILIVPDEVNNALLVRARPDDWVVIQQAIQAMDLRPLQVLIEVLIAEVQRTKGLQFSTAATVQQRNRGDTSTSLFTSLSGDLTNNFLLNVIRGGAVDVNAALSALTSRGHVQILSRPIILAQNNQEARILVGSEQPFVQVSQTQVGTVAQNQVVQYRDVGTQLTILPTINPDGYVNLQVQQQVSSATAQVQFGAPVISTREATTRLFLRDGQTAVIGGLVDHEVNKSRVGIPVLMDIPVLGALFGTTNNTVTQNELFLFLTPHIISTDDDTDRLRQGIDQKLPAFRDASPATDDALFPPRPSPSRPDTTGSRP